MSKKLLSLVLGFTRLPTADENYSDACSPFACSAYRKCQMATNPLKRDSNSLICFRFNSAPEYPDFWLANAPVFFFFSICHFFSRQIEIIDG